MQSKILTAVELIVAVCLTVVVGAVFKTQGTQKTSFDKLISIDVEQLPLQDGIIPVELRCESAHLTAPGRLEKFSCIAINHAKRNVTALSSTLTVITENSRGGESRSANLLYSDSYVHPDVQAIMRLRPTAPGESSSVQPGGPTTFEDEVIVRIELKLDYVEFDSNTSIGSNSSGAQVIRSIRQGASGYKRWLVGKYTIHKRDVDAIVPLLQDSDLPPELQDGGNNFKEGAAIYRNLMWGVYERQGGTELKKLLEK